MKIVYLGSGAFGLDSLDAILGSRHELKLIVTQPAREAGRGKKLKPTPAAQWARQNDIAFVETANVNTPEMIDKIKAAAADLIVVIAFGQKISNEVIGIAEKGAINVHSSLLPKYRGAAPINWALIKGETKTGVSIITLAEKMDAGDILAQAELEILPGETAGELHNRLAKLAAGVLVETIGKIENATAVHTPQDNSKASLAAKLKKSDGFLNFEEPAEILNNKIRGLTPWPGALAVYVSQKNNKEQKVTLIKTKVVRNGNENQLPFGSVNDELNIVCGKDCLKVIKIKPSDGRVMDFKSFVNGRSTRPGDLFVKIDS